jgi:hypothetical protein
MGNVKGSKLDPITGKYTRPEGWLPKAAPERERVKTPSSQAANASKRFEKERKSSEINYSFRIYKVQPTGKYWLADTLEPSLEYIAHNYGGGKYEVWKFFTDTGEYLGNPVPYNVDPTIWPPKIPDPQAAGRPMVGNPAYGGGGFFGNGPQQGYGPPQQGYGPPQQGYGPIGDSEDDIDELERDNSMLKAQVITITRERDDLKIAMERERAEAIRKEDRAQFEATLKALEAKFSGTKDPLDQMLSFSRLQAELNGGVVGKGGSTTDMLTLAMGLMNTIMTAAKSLPTEGSAGGASGLETIMRMADKYLPMITKLTEQKAGQVVEEKPAAAPAPVKEPDVVPTAGPETKAFERILDELPIYITTGETEKFANWIVESEGEGWPIAHGIMMSENPAGFLNLVMTSRPLALKSENDKKWVVDVMKLTQTKLLERKAKNAKG